MPEPTESAAVGAEVAAELPDGHPKKRIAEALDAAAEAGAVMAEAFAVMAEAEAELAVTAEAEAVVAGAEAVIAATDRRCDRDSTTPTGLNE